MRLLTLTTAILAATAVTAPAMAQDDDLRIVDEPLELTIHMHWARGQGYDETYPVETAACEMTGICRRDATVGPNTTEQREAFNLLLATGEIPDIVGGGAVKDFVNQYGPEGAFLPLGDLMAEHALNITAFFDAHPDLLEAIPAADGNIPYLPDGEFGRGTFIRQDWLDALGLEQPQNVEEVRAVLEAFRDGDPNGNGIADEISYFNRDWEEMVRLVTLWDGRTSGSDTYHDFMVTDAGQVVHPYA